MSKALVEKIDMLRKRHGLNRLELERKAGITESTIGVYEWRIQNSAPNARMSRKNVRKLADVLGYFEELMILAGYWPHETIPARVATAYEFSGFAANPDCVETKELRGVFPQLFELTPSQQRQVHMFITGVLATYHHKNGRNDK